MFGRRFLGIALALSLIPTPVPGNPSPLGVVTQATAANLGTGPVSVGASIYDGDHLSTDTDGALTIRGGAAMLYLARESRMTLRASAADSGGREAQLAAGTLVFSVSQAAALEILADNAGIRPTANTPTVGQITIVGPRTLDVYARQGALSFSYEDETEVIPEGKSYRVMLDPPDDDSTTTTANKPSAPDPRQPASGRHRRFLLILLGVGAAIGTIIRKLDESESPDHP